MPRKKDPGSQPPKRKKAAPSAATPKSPSARPFKATDKPAKGKFAGPKAGPSKFKAAKPAGEKPRPPKRSTRPETADRPDERPPRSEPRPTPAPPPAPEPVVEVKRFAELGLGETTLRALDDLGFETATPIQAAAIPVLIEGGDLIGLAQTGTGKTAAFGLPLIEKIDAETPEVQALVLAPTRELAVQVAKGIHDFAKYAGLRVVPVYGGQPIDRQFRALRSGAHIVVGTPGRVLDHMRRGSLRLDSVRVGVLDEADEMMALGFTEDMEAILAELPESRQLAFFSATMAPRVLAITEKFLREPKRVEIVAKQRTLETTNQTYYEVPPGKKQEALARVLDMETPGSTIVFCRTRLETVELSDALRLRGYGAEPIHGDMGQADRERVLRRFREGSADLLVATDVAARGLDIEGVTHVINYDVPYDVEQYIHRIGRTGRAGRTGDAITLIYHRERRQLANIERLIGAKIAPARIPTLADIANRRREAFMETLREALVAREFEPMLTDVTELTDGYDPLEVAAAAMDLLWKERHQDDRAPVEEETFAELEQPEIGMVRIFVGMGRHEGLRPGDLVGAITNEAGLEGKQIGVIEVHERVAFVEVPAAMGERVVDALSNAKIRNRRVKVQLARPAFELDPRPRRNG
jgi:ATP-dependent RNA helicase DeaD